MHTILLFAAVALVSPRSAAPLAPAAEAVRPAPGLVPATSPSASPAAVAERAPEPRAPTDPASRFKDSPATATFPHDSLQTVGAVILVLGLAAAALLLRRRKGGATRHIQILETAAIGPKRSLVLVSVGQQTLLLSCCDSGIALVSTQTASPEMLATADEAAAGLERPAVATLPFNRQLADAEESQGLRRLLAQAGTAR
jgi:flagellar biogenesis protein FliO